MRKRAMERELRMRKRAMGWDFIIRKSDGLRIHH